MIRKILLLAGFVAFAGAYAQKTTHTVVKGDNPYNIAKKYGMTLEELLRQNPKAKEGKLDIGDVLVVKGKSSTTTVPAPSAARPAKLGFIIIKPKQTIYSITKQYHITEPDLRKYNPDLESRMKIGERLNLPESLITKYADADAQNSSYSAYSPSTAAVPAPAAVRTPVTQTPVAAKPTQTYTNTGISDDDYITYTVVEGDTSFGIINKFGITLDELTALNPQLSSGLKPGMILKIKKADKAFVKKSPGALNVVIMLPFGYDSGDSKNRSLSVDFLAGAKLAIERNARRGQKLNVKVVDAGNETTFKNSLIQINKDNTDLIVGPVFKSNVLEVLNYVKGSNIPVVAPFANSEELYDYGNLIVVETADQVFAERIVKEVKEVYSNQKIYIVADADRTNAAFLKSNLETSLKNATVILVNSASEIKPDVNMMTGQSAPVIAILANSNDAVGQAFADKMIELSKNVQGNRSFSMYYAPVFEKKKDELSQANLVYLMDRTINTEGSFEKEILADYKSKYCKTPPKYAIIGFDVMNDMLMRENSKGEIFSQISKPQTQLATKFEFVRSKRNGAYVNNGLRVVRLVP